MIQLKTKEQIALMKEAGRITGEALLVAAEAAKEGVTTKHLDDLIRHHIEKSGAMKSFVSDEYYEGYKDSEWISNKIKTIEADVTGEVDIYKLIEYYKLLLLIDENCPMKSRQFISQQIQREEKFSYEIYGNNNLNNTITFIAYKYTSSENICDSLYGEELFELYFEIDPFTTTNETIFLY